VAGVILTNSEVDAVAGLLSMREGSPFTVYAHEKVLAILASNSIFNVLNEKNVKRQPIGIGEAFEPRLVDGARSGLEVLPFAVPGKSAWYLEGKAHPGGESGDGDTLGLKITDKSTGKCFYFIAACAEVTDALKAEIDGASLVFFDGTVWQDDEMIRAGLGHKTGKSMGHVAMSGHDGAIARLADLRIDKKIFLHINNSNPALLPSSPERKAVEAAGWQIPTDGTEIVL
jgi:pyrroloquinoline quinone biosynthesis protein B